MSVHGNNWRIILFAAGERRCAVAAIVSVIAGFTFGKATKFVKSGDDFCGWWCMDSRFQWRVGNGRGVDHRHHGCAVGCRFLRLFIQRRDRLSDCCHLVFFLLDCPPPEPPMLAYSVCTHNNRTVNMELSGTGTCDW